MTVLKDENAVRHQIAEQARLGQVDALYGFWSAIAWAPAGRADLAREALQQFELENQRSDIIVAEAIMQAARGVVLQAEGKDEQALAALANNGNHWAMLAHYQALARLGRRDEAERILRTLFDQVPTDVFSTGLPVAKYRFGNVISNP